MTTRALFRFQIAAALLLAALFALPHGINAVREKPQALIRIVTTDDGHYHARVKAALLGRYGEVGNGVTGGETVAKSSAPALVELLVGILFGWTGFHAPQVILLLTVLLTPLVVFPLVRLLRLLPLPDAYALFWGFLYILTFLGPLQKPVNMSLSLPFTILALLLLFKARKERTFPWILGSGIVLGIAPHIYFWSYTYLWAFTFFFFVFQFFQPTSEEKKGSIRTLLLVAAVTIIVASPFFFHLITASRSDPNFSVTAFRSTLIHSRGVESPVRALLLFGLLISSTLLAWKRRQDSSWIFPLAAVFAAFTAMHQNLIHGFILSFSSHYYPFVALSALLATAFAWELGKNSWLRIPITLIGTLFLLAGIWDYRSAWDIARGEYYVRDIQHLKPALTLLDDGKRETVLTDKVSAHMVTAWTDDDVVYTAYIKHLFIRNEEYAERYCLSEFFEPSGPDFTWLGSEVVERKEPEKIAERAKFFENVCAPILKDPSEALRRYNVSLILWNERLRPNARPTLPGIEIMEQGDGWSLWRFPVRE
ncbi:MAG: hypothetical protein AAB853_05295 [Patescibacteria group bacterium]|mgnify:CR=1 FL=1